MSGDETETGAEAPELNTVVVYPDKFKSAVPAHSTAYHVDPHIYMDSLTLIKSFMQSDLYKVFKATSNGDANMLRWDWVIKDGAVQGVGFTLFKADPV